MGMDKEKAKMNKYREFLNSMNRQELLAYAEDIWALRGAHLSNDELVERMVAYDEAEAAGASPRQMEY